MNKEETVNQLVTELKYDEGGHIFLGKGGDKANGWTEKAFVGRPNTKTQHKG
jgi:hypothetical protein